MSARAARRRPGRRRLFARRRPDLADRERALAEREREVETLGRVLEERHDAFVRAVTHQLRTPLATLLAASDALRPEHGELSTGQRDELVDIVVRQVDRLRRLVEDVVALVDPDSALSPSEVVTPVRGILESLADSYLPTRTVVVEADDDVALDAAQVVRLLGPLLRNIADHTPPGTAVRLRGGRHAELRGTLRLSVEDAGPGLAGDVSLVTAPFVTGEEAARRASPGVGIGLALVDSLARAAGGSLLLGPSELGGLEATVLLPDHGTDGGDVSRGS